MTDLWNAFDLANRELVKAQQQVEDLTNEVAALRESGATAYEDGHAAGDRARFARCKEDLERVLGVSTDGGRDWADLLRLVQAPR